MYLLRHPPPDHPPCHAVSENGKSEAEFNGKTVNPNQEKSGKPKAGINGKDGQSKSGKVTAEGFEWFDFQTLQPLLL